MKAAYGSNDESFQRLVLIGEAEDLSHELQPDSDAVIDRSKKDKISIFLRPCILIPVVTFIVLTLFAVIPKPSFYDSTLKTSVTTHVASYESSADAAATSAMNLIASNEYGTFKAPYPWMTDVPGTQLVEPYKTTTLTLTGTAVDSGLYSFAWIIEGFDGKMKEGASTQSIIVKEPKIFPITINAYLISAASSSSEPAFSYSTRLVSK
jgi:hypothetical protein